MNRNQVRSTPEVLHSKVCYIVFFLFKKERKDFPASPVAGTQSAQCWRLGFDHCGN